MKNNGYILGIIVSVFVFLVVIFLIGLLFYFNVDKNKTISIVGTVVQVNDGYITVLTEDNESYKLFTTDTFNKGDIINCDITDIEEKDNYYKASLTSYSLVSKNNDDLYSNEIKDKDNDSAIQNNDNNEKIDYSTSDNQDYDNFINSQENVSVVNYVNSVQDVALNNGDENTLKDGFVKIVDFVFYDGVINGKTYKDLSDSAKISVLSSLMKIDEVIDNKYPNYKSNLGSKFSDIKEKTVYLYLDKTSELCLKNDDLCSNAKDGLSTLKKNFHITWGFIKDIAQNNISKLSDWYKVWREV